jgi:hypothetical protein
MSDSIAQLWQTHGGVQLGGIPNTLSVEHFIEIKFNAKF